MTYNIPPVANITGPNVTMAYTRDVLTFHAVASYDNDGTIVKYHFDFGDHNSQDTTNPSASHYYTQPGGYLVTVVVTDNDGAVSAPASWTIFIGNHGSQPPGWIPGFGLVAVLAAVGAVSVLAGQRKLR